MDVLGTCRNFYVYTLVSYHSL